MNDTNNKKTNAILILKQKLKFYRLKLRYAGNDKQRIDYYRGMIEGIKIGLSVIGEI